MSRRGENARVPQGLDDADKIIFGRSVQDLMLFLFLPFAGLILLSIFEIIGLYSLLSGTVLILIGAIALFRLVGPNTHVLEYLQAKLHWSQLAPHAPATTFTGPTDSPTRPLEPDGGRFENDVEDLTASPSDVKVWQEQQDAAEFTKVKNVYPQFDIIERADGVFVTALEVESGPNVFLRSEERKAQLTTEFTRALNSLDFPLQTYVTTDAFDIDDHRETYAAAGRHEAVKNNPILNQLYEDYNEKILDDPRINRTRVRSTYIILTVDPETLDTTTDGDAGLDSVQDLLDALPRLWADSEATFEEDELETRKLAFNVLEDRRETAYRYLTEIDDVELSAVDYETHLGELRGHWRSPMQSAPVEVPASPIVPPEGMFDDADSGGLLA